MPSSADKYKTFPRIVPLTRGDFVGRELYDRKQKSFGKNAIPRATYVRAVSNATKSGGIVGNFNVLVGGLLSKSFYTRGSFDTLYRRAGRSIQDMPIPGIDSISVTSKGELQSLRKVTINWSCPNLEDLNDLAPYWLTPGISVWVEWGWVRQGRRPVMANPIDVDVLTRYYLDAGEIYDDIIIKSTGNQDGYMGIITNFSFNMNEDRSWTCSTELTSLGQTLLTADLNKDKVYKNASFTGDPNQTETIKGFIEDKFSEGDLLELPRSDGKTWKEDHDVINLTQIDGGFAWFDKDRKYVTWRFIEHEIINKHLSLVFKGKGGTGVAVQMDSVDTLISNDEFLFSTDADIGLVVHSSKPFPTRVFDAGNSKSGYISNLYFEAEYVKDTFLNSETLEEALMKLLRGMSNACADIWNFKIQPTPQKESILQVIDLNYVNGEDINRVRGSLLDTDVEDSDKILSFGGMSGESILASVSFTSKLTDQLAMKYVFARNKSEKQKNAVLNDDNDAGVTTMFGGYRDRILDNLEPLPTPPETEDEKSARIKREEEKAKADAEEQEKRKNFSVSLTDLRVALTQGKVPKNADAGFPANIIVLDSEGKDLLVEYIQRDFKVDGNGNITENQVRHNPMYPLEISVGIDGISGILPGNCFTLDNVPELYKTTGVFQVVEVGHDISGDDWTTNLRCFFRYVLTQTTEKIYYSADEEEIAPENNTSGGASGGAG